MPLRPNSFLSRLSRAAAAILDGVAEAVDHLVTPDVDLDGLPPEMQGIPVEEITPADIRRMMMRSAMRADGMLPAEGSVPPRAEPEDVIAQYPLFPERNFKYPKHIVNMDLEIVEVDDDEMFDPQKKTIDRTYVDRETGEKIVKYTDEPIIAVTGVRRLDEQDTMVMLTMRDSFSFLSELLFQIPHGWTEEESDEVLTQVVARIMKKSGWTYEETLMSLLIRDFLEPMIVQVNNQRPEALDETIRLFVSKEGRCRWAIVPYHSPSLTLGDLITPDHEDFPHMPDSDSKYGEDDYVEGEEEQ